MQAATGCETRCAIWGSNCGRLKLAAANSFPSPCGRGEARRSCYRQQPQARGRSFGIDFHQRAIRHHRGDIDIEPGNHGEIGQCRALHHDRVGRLSTSAAGITPRDAISCSIQAVATPPFAASSTRMRPT